MRESFITPRPKKGLPQELVWMGMVFMVILIALIAAFSFLSFANGAKRATIVQINAEIKQVQEDATQTMHELQSLSTRDQLRATLQTANQLVLGNIKSFFDLVPDGITLEAVSFDNAHISVRGVTRSRKLYHKSLGLFLESEMGANGQVSFKKLKHGYLFKYSVKEK